MSCTKCEELTKQLQDAWEKILELDKIAEKYVSLQARLALVGRSPVDDRTIVLQSLMLEEDHGIETSGKPALESPGSPSEESEETEEGTGVGS